MRPSLPIPSIFAHRGDSLNAPENTLAAFQRAVETGCEGIELDVRLTADSQVVVCHDAAVNRTTNGRGRINRLTLAQVGMLDAGAWFDTRFRNERIPTLAQVFDAFGGKTWLNLELKPNRNDSVELAQQVAKLIKEFNLQKQVIISSFNTRALQAIREQIPEGYFSLLSPVSFIGWWARNITFNQSPYFALHPHFKDVTPASLKRIPRQIAYTVNKPGDLRRLFSWGIQGIITDDPGLAVKIRAEVQT
jgi:glycerophosphoryl diester phosphodiesterase